MRARQSGSKTRSLLDRLGQIPGELTQVLERPLPNLRVLNEPPTTWDVVGLGASEGPARLFCSVANRSRLRASQVAPSEFLRRQSSTPPNHGLMLFSQGLSPHAKLALTQAPHYGETIVVTSKSEVEVLSHLPKEVHPTISVASHPAGQEQGGLLRIVGSTCAALMGLRLAQKLGYLAPQISLERVVKLYEYGAVAVDERIVNVLVQSEPALCLAMSADLPSAHQLMWKWQEATCLRLPPAIDVLSFAHGPFQSIYDRTATIVALRSASTAQEDEVWARLNAILVPERHQVLQVTSPVDFPFSYFAHEATFLRHLAEVVVRRGVDLSSWPGQYADSPLYELTDLDVEDGC